MQHSPSNVNQNESYSEVSNNPSVDKLQQTSSITMLLSGLIPVMNIKINEYHDPMAM